MISNGTVHSIVPRNTDTRTAQSFHPIRNTLELKPAFLSSLEERGISLQFFAKSWEAFDLANIPPQGYDIVLTSETICRAESLPSLITLLRSACLNAPNHQRAKGDKRTNSLCLIPVEVGVYFGVGGGASDFEDKWKPREAGQRRYFMGEENRREEKSLVSDFNGTNLTCETHEPMVRIS